MEKFKIGIAYEMYGHIEVEADTLEEAIKEVQDNSEHYPLPDSAEYMEGSYTVDPEGSFKVFDIEKGYRK
jgi:hypothetical protein